MFFITGVFWGFLGCLNEINILSFSDVVLTLHLLKAVVLFGHSIVCVSWGPGVSKVMTSPQ